MPKLLDAAAIDEVLARGDARTVYQPIVSLATGEVVAYEALARGGVSELDWLHRAAALGGALDAGLPRLVPLFVNLAPETLNASCPPEHTRLVETAHAQLDLVAQVTEETVAADPAELLRAADDLRRRGCAVALDDVGTHMRALALMPVLGPEVVKLDMRRVGDRPTFEMATVANAVFAQAERSGAAVVSEGLATPDQVETARALGAEFGQGPLFGDPAPLPAGIAAPRVPLRLRRRAPTSDPRTPFEIVSSSLPLRRGDKALLLKISRQLEHQATAQGAATLLLSTFQEGHHYTALTGDMYSALAQRLSFVGVLARDLAPEPSPGVRGAPLDDDDALTREWNVTVVAPHFASAFVARDLGDGGPDARRRFDFALTYDRELAIASAGTLLRRLASLQP